MKTLADESLNKINLVGKLLDATFDTGKTQAGAPYERAKLTVRVTQTYGGKEETSEIPVSMFATQFTKKGGTNPAYKSIQDLKGMHTAQADGYDEADVISLTGTTISENAYVAKSGKVVDGWQLRSSFVNKAKLNSVGSFNLDIYILGMKPEEDRDGDTTGRFIVRGALVQYAGRVDVIDFIVEDPAAVEFIENNWEVDQTVNIKGRIRVTSSEVVSEKSESSWGEDIPETTTRYIRELIITKGDDQGKDEEFAYDPVEIKKGLNARKANMEQLQIDAQGKGKSSGKAAAPTAKAKPNYGWEE